MSFPDHPPVTDADDSESNTRTHVTCHDWGSGARPSRCVVDLVSEALGAGPCQMRPLFEAVDPDALDALFGTAHSRSGQPAVDRVSFRYEGHDVTVLADGRTVATERDGERP